MITGVDILLYLKSVTFGMDSLLLCFLKWFCLSPSVTFLRLSAFSGFFIFSSGLSFDFLAELSFDFRTRLNGLNEFALGKSTIGSPMMAETRIDLCVYDALWSVSIDPRLFSNIDSYCLFITSPSSVFSRSWSWNWFYENSLKFTEPTGEDASINFFLPFCGPVY